MTPSRRCCSTDGDVFARRADVTTDGEMRAKRIEASEPKAGHRAPPMRAPHTPATAVDCYEVHSPSMRVAACPQRELQSAQERPPRRRFGGLACSAAIGLLCMTSCFRRFGRFGEAYLYCRLTY